MYRFHLNVSYRTHVGHVREKNEDAFCVIRDGKQIEGADKDIGSSAFDCNEALLAVSDGMGGGVAGDYASRAVVEALGHHFEKRHNGEDLDHSKLESEIEALIHLMHENLLSEGEEDSSLDGMGATLSGIVFHRKGITVGHVGDSRVYRFRDGKLEMLTIDHSQVWDLVIQGRITADQARTYPGKNVLKQILGANRSINLEPHVTSSDVKQGDIYLICSDGLSDGVADHQIAQLLGNEETLIDHDGTMHGKTEALIDLALKNHGRDNITAVMIEIEKLSKTSFASLIEQLF